MGQGGGVSKGTESGKSQVLRAVGTESSSAVNETSTPKTKPGLSCLSNLEEIQLATDSPPTLHPTGIFAKSHAPGSTQGWP